MPCPICYDHGYVNDSISEGVFIPVGCDCPAGMAWTYVRAGIAPNRVEALHYLLNTGEIDEATHASLLPLAERIRIYGS